jgi:hypothetical protein
LRCTQEVHSDHHLDSPGPLDPVHQGGDKAAQGGGRPQEVPPANPVSVDGKLLFTEEQWLARQKEKQEGSSSSKDRS